jgi:hypothetical protein
MKKTHGWVVLALLGAMMMSGLALGQTSTSSGPSGQTDPNKKDNTLKPPTPSKPDDPPLVMTYLGGIVVVGLMGFAALIPSKRGHQD